MKLKCIGGRCDGMIVDVETPKYRQGDAVRVPNYPTSIALSEIIPSMPVASINYFIYIIDVFRYTHKDNDTSEIWFLRPENFNMFDAIKFQFNK